VVFELKFECKTSKIWIRNANHLNMRYGVTLVVRSVKMTRFEIWLFSSLVRKTFLPVQLYGLNYTFCIKFIFSINKTRGEKKHLALFWTVTTKSLTLTTRTITDFLLLSNFIKVTQIKLDYWIVRLQNYGRQMICTVFELWIYVLWF